MNEPEHLKHGMWVFSDGDHSFLDEEKNKDNQPDVLPYRVLSRLVRHLSEEDGDEKGFNIAAVRRWVRMNPPPLGKGEQGLLEWNQQLAVTAIYSGLTLVWRGGIVTSLDDLDEVKRQVRETRALSRLDWPEDAQIVVTTLNEKKGSEDNVMSMRELTQG